MSQVPRKELESDSLKFTSTDQTSSNNFSNVLHGHPMGTNTDRSNEMSATNKSAPPMFIDAGGKGNKTGTMGTHL